MTNEVHPVDQMLPTPRLLALGLEHVLVLYAGAVAVPLIIGRALKLSPEDVAVLICSPAGWRRWYSVSAFPALAFVSR
jgi:NCS2 family nucleobase:cation symporter-2